MLVLNTTSPGSASGTSSHGHVRTGDRERELPLVIDRPLYASNKLGVSPRAGSASPPHAASCTSIPPPPRSPPCVPTGLLLPTDGGASTVARHAGRRRPECAVAPSSGPREFRSALRRARVHGISSFVDSLAAFSMYFPEPSSTPPRLDVRTAGCLPSTRPALEVMNGEPPPLPSPRPGTDSPSPARSPGTTLPGYGRPGPVLRDGLRLRPAGARQSEHRRLDPLRRGAAPHGRPTACPPPASSTSSSATEGRREHPRTDPAGAGPADRTLRRRSRAD